MNRELREILMDIRGHLRHQKAVGNDYLPLKELKMMGKTLGGRANKEARLRALRDELGNCKLCRLAEGRTNLVFGVGNADADLMFVGEAPGSEEDRQGIPFVGRAGQLLTKIIEAMGIRREDVYIGNVTKCRPPENRNPAPDEIAMCEPFLLKQIEIIEPKVIVCLGTFAAQLLLNTDEKISKLRGRLFDFHNTKLMPTYHPAFLLRNPDMKKPVWKDMQKVMAVLGSRRDSCQVL